MPAADALVQRIGGPQQALDHRPEGGVEHGPREETLGVDAGLRAATASGRYSRPARASSPTSRAMFVSCIATPRSQARASTVRASALPSAAPSSRRPCPRPAPRRRTARRGRRSVGLRRPTRSLRAAPRAACAEWRSERPRPRARGPTRTAAVVLRRSARAARATVRAPPRDRPRGPRRRRPGGRRRRARTRARARWRGSRSEAAKNVRDPPRSSSRHAARSDGSRQRPIRRERLHPAPPCREFWPRRERRAHRRPGASRRRPGTAARCPRCDCAAGTTRSA